MGLQVTPTTGHSDRFIEGERIIVQLVQAGYDGYLYVDYYTVEGRVVHLYPNPGEPDSGRVLRGGERFNVGESARTWSVGPPFGQELITVISSPTPLYQGERSEEHTSELQSLMRISYAVFCLKKKKTNQN